jgi:beta-lactamase regulating signal transducer with metallopeptidase domain
MTDAFASLIPALATTLLHFLWQGTLIGVLAWTLLTALHNARPQTRYLVACLALLACVLMPLLTFATLLMQAHTSALPALPMAFAASAQEASAAAFFRMEWASSARPILSWVVLLWVSGAGALTLRLACGLLWVRQLCNRPACGSAQHWQCYVDRLASGFNIRRPVRVRLIESGDSPLSVGWWKPMVLLPAAIVANMPAPLLGALIAHELAHVRRHDYLVNLLQGMVEAVLFYHPAVWWLSHRIRIERELVADDLAAKQLGDPRRLALALSELDRLSITQPPIPHTTLAQAAHGGQLMSRIKQLIRPEHRLVGSALLLPAVGILALGMAFQAYAKLGSPAPAAQATPAPPAKPAPPAPPAEPVQIGRHPVGSGTAYALVNQGQESFMMSGDHDDVRDIRAAKKRVAGDFLWFRRDGKTYIVQDASLLMRANQTRAGAQVHEEKMQALQAQMQPHQAKLDALSKRMDALQVTFDASPQLHEAEQATHALSHRQQALAEQQRKLSLQSRHANPAERERLDRQLQQLDAQQEALGAQIERQSAVLERQQQRIQDQSAQMEAVAHDMEAASKPMEVIGNQMEAVGKQLEQQAIASDRQIRSLIDEALRQGLAPVSR